MVIILINNQTVKEHFRPWWYDIYNRNSKIKSTKLVSPPGEWSQTCQLVDYRPPIIWADCKNTSGIYKITSKNMSDCGSKKLSNIDGRLHC